MPVDTGTERAWSAPYRTGSVLVSPRHELHTPEARPALRKVLTQVPRKVLPIAPAERHVALYELAVECPGMSEDELIKQACEFFGWRRMGKDIRDCLAADLAELRRQRRLERDVDRVGVVR
ncbi:hypothetical protein [Streptomyces cellostaticus]|uniref:hypothetical protein n=1 Tax=Streptomyces cellostaticus TaxID=67285 RepID=UPI000AB3EBEA|nr:hypothetical protein [Streptomyces cellostaticus]